MHMLHYLQYFPVSILPPLYHSCRLPKHLADSDASSRPIQLSYYPQVERMGQEAQRWKNAVTELEREVTTLRSVGGVEGGCHSQYPLPS